MDERPVRSVLQKVRSYRFSSSKTILGSTSPDLQRWISAIGCICSHGIVIPQLVISKGENSAQNGLYLLMEFPVGQFFHTMKGWTNNLHAIVIGSRNLTSSSDGLNSLLALRRASRNIYLVQEQDSQSPNSMTSLPYPARLLPNCARKYWKHMKSKHRR